MHLCSIIKQTAFQPWHGGACILSVYLWRSTETALYAIRKAFSRPQPKWQLNLCPKQDTRGPNRPHLRFCTDLERLRLQPGKCDSFLFTCQLSRGVEAWEYTKFTEIYSQQAKFRNTSEGQWDRKKGFILSTVEFLWIWANTHSCQCICDICRERARV